MAFYQRGFLYLVRKRAKSLLLFLVFLLVGSMILSTTLILQAAQTTEARMQEKAKAKVVCEMTDSARPLTEDEAREIGKLTSVNGINRMGQKTAFLSELSPVTSSDSTKPDNQKVTLLSFDSLEDDGPFVSQSYRIMEGMLFGSESDHGAVINVNFAKANGLEIGDSFSLETEDGKRTTVKVLGEYLAGSETRQQDTTLSVQRIENQIYLDNTAYLELFPDGGFYQFSVYTDKPEELSALSGKLQEILKDQAELTTSDALYQQMQAPLTEITRIVQLMRMLTVLTGEGIVSLLLCMWMRSRQREMAVFVSMGEAKWKIFLQALLESAVLFLASSLISLAVGTLFADPMKRLLLRAAASDLSLEISVQCSDVVFLLGSGSAVVVIAVLLSLIPVIRTNPRDLLSRMEG